MRPVDLIVGVVMPKGDWLWEKILIFFSFFGLIKFVGDPPREQIFNRSLIILDEAKKRGIEVEAIKIFGNFKNEYRYRLPGLRAGAWRYFEANPLADEHRSLSDHKGSFKKLMRKAGVPVPEGQLFTRQRRAIGYAEILGFPLVVKPATGSLGYHSTYEIQNQNELKRAMEIAQIFRPDFIVERHILGENFRATVIGRQQVFVCGKDRANVVGDGRSTIGELIDEKNSDPRRGDYGPKNVTLHKIPKDHAMLRASLAEQNLDFDFVPLPGQKIYLFKDFVPGSGIDFVNITGRVHKENLELFLKAARVLETDLVGFDLIAEDMTRPYYAQTFAMLEANSLPYLDLHQFPSHGEPSDIAKIVWDVTMEKLL